MRWVKRFVLWGIVGSAALLLLFGPRPHLEGPEGVVIVDYWEKWGGLEGSQMEQIVDTFNETVGREKKIFVRYLSVSSVNQKTLVSTAAGVPPDIAGMWEVNIPQFASLGALEPLDELAAEYGITEGHYKPIFWESCHYQGTLYGLVSTPWVVGLYWHKQVFEDDADRLREAGLDPGRAPATLEELDAYAAVLNVVDEHGWVSRAGYLPLHPGWFNVYLPIWFGGELYDPSSGRLLYDSEESIRAYTWLRSYSELFGVESMTEFRSGLTTSASPTDPFMVGTLAMQKQGPFFANYAEDLAPHLNRWKMSKEEEQRLPPEERRGNYAWGVVPFPSAAGDERTTYAAFDALVIPRGAQHKREAFAFMAYLNRQEVMEKLCSLHSKNSPLGEVSQAFLDNHPNPYIDEFEALASSPHARSVPPIPVWPEVSQEVDHAVQRVYLMQMTPREAMRQAQERSQRKLDRFMEIDRKRKALTAGRGASS